MRQFFQQVVNGTVLGATYGLIALGYTMVYGIIQLINFAHGEIFMVGSFAGLAAHRWLLPESLAGNPWVALTVMLVVAVLVAVLGRGPDGAAGLPAAARRPPAGAADHGHRRVDLPAGGGPDLLPGREPAPAVPHR